MPPAPSWKAPLPASATTAAGTQVVVLPQHELPIVHLLVTVPAGSALDPPQRPGLAAAVAGMLQDGGAGGALARPSWPRRSPTLGTELEEHVDTDQVQLPGRRARRATSTRTLALLGDLVARPRFDRRRLAAGAGAAHRRDPSPPRRARAPRRRCLRPRALRRPSVRPPVPRHRRIGARHHRRRPARVLGRALRTASPSRFVLVGDTDARSAAHKRGARRSPAGARRRGYRRRPAARRRCRRRASSLVDRPDAPQSEIRVGHLGARAQRRPTSRRSSLLETVLGGSFTSRLNLNLREKHGYTYGARASFDLRIVAGPFVASAGVRTDATAAALKETVAEIAGMHAPLSRRGAAKGAPPRHEQRRRSVRRRRRDGGVPRRSGRAPPARSTPGPSCPPSWPRSTSRHYARRRSGCSIPMQLTIVVVGDRKVDRARSCASCRSSRRSNSATP